MKRTAGIDVRMVVEPEMEHRYMCRAQTAAGHRCTKEASCSFLDDRGDLWALCGTHRRVLHRAGLRCIVPGPQQKQILLVWQQRLPGI